MHDKTWIIKLILIYRFQVLLAEIETDLVGEKRGGFKMWKM